LHSFLVDSVILILLIILADLRAAVNRILQKEADAVHDMHFL